MKTVVVLRVFHNRIFVVERQQEENTYKGRSVTGSIYLNFYKSNDLSWNPWAQIGLIMSFQFG